jgi:hypothetical protein
MNLCFVPSASVNAIQQLVVFGQFVSALLGWMSSGRPSRISVEIPIEKLLPSGDSVFFSRLL